MSQCIVPNWNLKHQQRHEQVEAAEDGNRSSHVNNSSLSSSQQLFSMSNYGVAELTWENGQLAMHGLGGGLLSNPSAPTKPTWGGRSNDTLESIVHQATYHKEGLTFPQNDHKTPTKMTSSAGKLSDSSGQVAVVSGLLKKRMRPDSDLCGRNFSGSMQEEIRADRSSACASASATFCRDNDKTMMTWASYESPRSLKTKTADEDSACHGGSENQDEDHETKGEIGRSHSSRRSRAAAVHNQSERRRRDRINQKMKALQRLVPNASKTDKASMLDEVIDYLKQLQAQIQMMSMRNMPQMMMPLGTQQHLQMSLLARMGMGIGLGMGMGTQSLPQLIHPGPVSATAPAFVPSPFIMPSMIATCPPAQANPEPSDTRNAAAAATSVPLSDPYCAFLAQSMNMELYNKMAALYRQQVNQSTQAKSSPSQSNQVQRD